jgi:predicted nucleotidyltransferase component of viral defense system
MSEDLLKRLQMRFLRELFRNTRGGFVLKGGLALSILYGDSRGTRDADLDFPGTRTADSLHNQVMRALKEALRGTGITDVRIHEPKKGELSPKWKVTGRGPNGELIPFKVEVSRRPPPPGRVRQVPVAGAAALGLGPFYVDSYAEETLIALKLAALLGRTAARDVYDLDVLMSTHTPDRDLMDWALSSKRVTPQSAAAAISEQLGGMSYELFRTDMLAANPEILERIDAPAWAEMKHRVQTALTAAIRNTP